MSLVYPKMASNYVKDNEMEQSIPHLDLTRPDIRNILDGNKSVDGGELPSVPTDLSTNPFVNPILNQTLGEITNRDLGPLTSLKIKDADTVIRKLSNKLKVAAEKNDNSTALLQ